MPHGRAEAQSLDLNRRQTHRYALEHLAIGGVGLDAVLFLQHQNFTHHMLPDIGPACQLCLATCSAHPALG